MLNRLAYSFNPAGSGIAPDRTTTVVTTPPRFAVVLLPTYCDVLPPPRNPQNLLTLINGVRIHGEQPSRSHLVFVLHSGDQRLTVFAAIEERREGPCVPLVCLGTGNQQQQRRYDTQRERTSPHTCSNRPKAINSTAGMHPEHPTDSATNGP